MPNNYCILFLAGLLLLTSGCGKKKTEEIKSGRLSFVKTLHYGMVGTHGSHGWYVSDRKFYVNGKSWSPKGIDVNDRIANAEASPNAAVEAIKCYSFADSKETAYVLRMKADQPEWVLASAVRYDGGDNLGEWTGDGRWLLFKDYFFNAETSERKEIKGLPYYPGNYFLSASPDLETIMYREFCYRKMYDAKTAKPLSDEETDKRCEMFTEHIKKGIAGFWLIEAKTGSMKMLELNKDEYPWATNSHSYLEVNWLKEFRSKLLWEKDKSGKYVLVYPK